MKPPIRTILRRALRTDRTPSADVPAWAPADRAADNAWTILDGAVERRFFFVTGCSKSGTHWVQNLLNLHPLVCVKGEFHFEHLLNGYRAMVDRVHYTGAKPHVRPTTDAAYEGMVRRMMYMASRDKPEAVWIGDRTPRLLGEILPGAPIVNIRRDGRDVMVSWNFHHLRVARLEYLPPAAHDAVARMGPEYLANPMAYTQPGSGLLGEETWFRAQAAIWARNVEHELAEAPRLRDRGTPLLDVRYESIHEDLDAARTRMYRFLRLNDGDAAVGSPGTELEFAL